MPPNMSIAIIDDDLSAREGVTDLVRASGYDVLPFASAEAFLAFDDAAAIRCLIVDLHLGRMSGLDLHDHLTASGAAVTTILITAYPDERIRLRARASGVVCCLRKPFVAQELIACLRRALGEPRGP